MPRPRRPGVEPAEAASEATSPTDGRQSLPHDQVRSSSADTEFTSATLRFYQEVYDLIFFLGKSLYLKKIIKEIHHSLKCVKFKFS